MTVVIDMMRGLGSRLAVVTGLGWLVLAGSAAGWLLGARLGWVEPVLGAAAGLLTFLLCGLFTLGRTTLRVDLAPHRRRLVAGEATAVDVRVTNLAGHRLLPLALEVGVGSTVEPFDLPGIPGNGGSHTTTFDVSAARRGVVPIGPATTVRADPLGLMRRRVAWTGVTEVFVHPVTVRLEPLGHGLLRDLEGRITNDVSMSDLAFHTLREYVPGDDRRYIHWRSSAKVGSSVPGGRFLVRQFRDTRRTHLLAIVDGDPAAYGDPDHFETAVSVGASVAVRAIDDELDATVFVADRWARERTGRRLTRQAVLDTCARAELRGGGLADLVARAVRLAPGATFALLVTGVNTTYTTLRRVTAQLPPEVRATAVRVDPSARPGLSNGSTLRMLTLADLADLRPLLMRGEGG